MFPVVSHTGQYLARYSFLSGFSCQKCIDFHGFEQYIYAWFLLIIYNGREEIKEGLMFSMYFLEFFELRQLVFRKEIIWFILYNMHGGGRQVVEKNE